MTSMTVAEAQAPDLEALKAKQQATWSSGDYGVIGSTLQIIGETLVEAIDIRSGMKVLDVACGNGNAALAAARRYADVTGIDYVPALVEAARRRAAADGLQAQFETGDAEALPFDDGSFDAVTSVVGVMFTANHERAAAEMMRVVRPGGVIAMANWTPGGFIGQLFKLMGRHVAPPPGAKSPALWGSPERIEQMFGPGSAAIATAPKFFTFRYRSPEHFLEVFRTFYGPTLKAFAAVGPEGAGALASDLLALLGAHNQASDGTLVIPSEYLEVRITRS